MSVTSDSRLRLRRFAFAVLSVACLSAWSIVLSPAATEAGSFVIPAWSFARGNVVIDADPEKYADAGPLVVGGEEEPWGWTVEYDFDAPIEAEYTFQICYATAEARPVEIIIDGRVMARCCSNVTFASVSAEQDEPTFNSSGAAWEDVHRPGGHAFRMKLAEGKHTLKMMRDGPLPNLLALRVETPGEFPEGWKAAEYKVRNIDAVPVEFRGAFAKKSALPPPMDSQATRAASLTIPAWTFQRGNARVYASPDEYADGTPLVGDGLEQSEKTADDRAEVASVEYDIDFPVDADYTLQFHYASANPRPVDIWLDGKHMGKACNGVTIDSRPTEYPVTFASTARVLRWQGAYNYKTGKLLALPVSKGKHTLKISRRGPLPNIATLRLDSSTAFPEGWKQPQRKGDITRVAPRFRSIFLPPGAVNTAALRAAIEDTLATHGSEYPDAEQYLRQLDDLEAKQIAAENGTAEEKQKIEDELAALRSRAMLNHPTMNFDKLLFLKRSSGGYGHTYADQQAGGSGGNLCVLSPVGPDGKVSTLVPELDGGLFDRFDLSFDAKKVVFAYRKEGPFRIHEIDIDPKTGKMVPGSLRQLTFGPENETEALAYNAAQGRKTDCGFNDMDPCYLPDGRIVFVSTRSQRNVFCAGSTVTTLYIMDADGKNIRCLSAGPINELSPSVLEDGRILYTRWEYVDKGLGNGAGLWTLRPDGSGSEHIYKNNTVWPAGMANARGIPGSRKIVTIGGGHHFTALGTVVLVDARRNRRTTEAMNCITPETGYPPSMGPPTSKFGMFMDPYPLSEKFFLVSHKYRSHGGPFKILALDAWGNRTEVHADPAIDCFEAMPLVPRRTPKKIAALAAKNKAMASAAAIPGEKEISKGTATLFIQDIYRGMKGIERGRVKYVRVMAALEWPWTQRGMNNVGVDVHRKKVYGVVKVHEDGSAYFKVPAEENIFFQALDEDFMSLQHMATFINLMPGEQRACIGCHELRRDAPSPTSARAMAMNNPPQDIVPQPGDTGPRMVHFPADVQPVLDKNCVSCHGGENAAAGLDLAEGRAYKSLLDALLVNYRACGYGSAHFRAVPPLTHGSHLSKLAKQIRVEPCKSNLTREEFIKIVTWIDANVPFHGHYGKITLGEN